MQNNFSFQRVVKTKDKKETREPKQEYKGKTWKRTDKRQQTFE